MFTIIKYALAGYVGYMLYQEYIAKSITVKRNNQKMAKWEDYLEEGHLAKILTVGSAIAVAIGVSYAVKTYLDYLRIKLVKAELKQMKKSNKIPIKTEENWNINEES